MNCCIHKVFKGGNNMLKIWMDRKNCTSENIVKSPDSWYQDYRSSEVLKTDLAHEIIKNTSAVTEIYQDEVYLTTWGYKIGDDKLSEGCKCLLMMLSEESVEEDLVFYLSNMGENCEVYMEQIADIHDVTIILSRPYIAYLRHKSIPKSGVMIMETGEVVYDMDAYHERYLEYYNPY